jgi:hypothetical protein
MADDRERFTKILAVAMHPETMATEALAAFYRARELAKASPSLAHRPSELAPALRQPSQGRVYRARITSVRQDRVLILLALLSKRAYELDLKYQISFDYGDSPTAIDLVWRGPDMECKGLQWTVECAVNYINVKTGLNQVI